MRDEGHAQRVCEAARWDQVDPEKAYDILKQDEELAADEKP